jgi:hypothetical protein
MVPKPTLGNSAAELKIFNRHGEISFDASTFTVVHGRFKMRLDLSENNGTMTAWGSGDARSGTIRDDVERIGVRGRRKSVAGDHS